MPLEGILDPAAEKTRLTKELGKVEGYAVAQEKKNDAADAQSSRA